MTIKLTDESGNEVEVLTPEEIAAETAKAKLIEMYVANIVPINQALIDKALSGDVSAIRELHDRVYGKASQPVEHSGVIDIGLILDEIENE